MNEQSCKSPTILSSQTKKSASRPICTSSTSQKPPAMEATLSKANQTPQDVSAAMIGRKLKSMTAPFLITFEIFNMNVHNCLVDSGASSTMMPYAVAKRLHATLEKTGTRIMQFDRTNMKLIGELKDVFEDDEQILEFFHYEKTFKNAIIDEKEHGRLMSEKEDEEKDQSNMIPKSVVKMELLYDLHDKFKNPTNCKTHSSSMKYESVNLGTKEDPKNVNLGLGCSPQEKATFVELFKEYKDVFAWTYGDLKTFDTSIMQHVIPLEKEARPYQQKLRKMHPSLKPLVKKELNKMLDAKITFPVRHTRWVANLVPVRKKNGDIRLCIDFRNLNKASQKDNYPVPSMEHILQCVFGSEMLSLLDGFSGYNQVLVSNGD
eukprot:PITA_20675